MPASPQFLFLFVLTNIAICDSSRPKLEISSTVAPFTFSIMRRKKHDGMADAGLNGVLLMLCIIKEKHRVDKSKKLPSTILNFAVRTLVGEITGVAHVFVV